MREQIIKSLLVHAEGQIAKHKANVEIYLAHPVGIGEHGDVMATIEQEINTMAQYQEQIDVINKYFTKES